MPSSSVTGAAGSTLESDCARALFYLAQNAFSGQRNRWSPPHHPQLGVFFSTRTPARHSLALVPLHPRCNASPPCRTRVFMRHSPSPMPFIAGTVPAASGPLAPCASGSVQTAATTLIGLTLSRANAIGGYSGKEALVHCTAGGNLNKDPFLYADNVESRGDAPLFAC